MRYTESFWTINGSSADILFAEAFDKMEIPRGRLERSDTLLVEKNIDALGKITLPVTFGDNQVGTRTEDIIFDVADIPYKCNAIMGRGTICKFLAAVHQAYLCMKIPGPKGPIVVFGDQVMARRIEYGIAPGQRGVHVINTEAGARPSADEKQPVRKELQHKELGEAVTIYLHVAKTIGAVGASAVFSSNNRTRVEIIAKFHDRTSSSEAL